MIDAMLAVMVLGTVAVALAVEVAVLAGWLRPLAGRIRKHVRRCGP
jgi:hypothetical protein